MATIFFIANEKNVFFLNQFFVTKKCFKHKSDVMAILRPQIALKKSMNTVLTTGCSAFVGKTVFSFLLFKGISSRRFQFIDL